VGKTIFLTKEQRQPLFEQAQAIVEERYERLCALSDDELLRLDHNVEGLELGGVRMTLVTYTPQPAQPAFGVIIETKQVRLWRWLPAPRWTLAHRAFWFVDGQRKPFEDDDYS